MYLLGGVSVIATACVLLTLAAKLFRSICTCVASRRWRILRIATTPILAASYSPALVRSAFCWHYGLYPRNRLGLLMASLMSILPLHDGDSDAHSVPAIRAADHIRVACVLFVAASRPCKRATVATLNVPPSGSRCRRRAVVAEFWWRACSSRQVVLIVRPSPHRTPN